MILKSIDKVIYCYNCRKKTLFTRRDMNNNFGVDTHCSECAFVWFEWQNRAVEREREKWLEYNGGDVNIPVANQIIQAGREYGGAPL